MAFAALLFYAVIVLIRPHEWGDLVNEEFTIVRDTLLLCLVLFAFHRDKNFRAPQFPLMVGFLGAIFMSVLAAGWLGGGIEQTDIFFRIAFVPFMLISGLTDSLKRHHVFISIIIVAALFMVANGHHQATNEDGLGLVGNPVYVEGPNSVRITYIGFLADPNDLGMFIVMSMPLVVYFKNRAPAALGFLFWGAIGVLVYGVVLTNSRGTLLATLSLLGLWFWRKYGTVKTGFLGVAGSPGLLFVMSQFREIDASEDSAQGRLDAWYAGYQMLLSSPIFGIGQGSFTEYHRLTAHNSFVLAFSELGLLGCLLWVSLLTVTVMTMLKIGDRKFLPEGHPVTAKQAVVVEQESQVAITLLYCMLAYMVSGFFLSRTYIPVLYIFLGLAAACLGRVWRAFPELPRAAFFEPKQVAKFSAGFTLGGIFLVWMMVRVLL